MKDIIAMLDEIDAQLDPACSGDANIQHLRHMLLGYRQAALGLTRSPWSPGSARDVSWQVGQAMQQQDKLGATKS